MHFSASLYCSAVNPFVPNVNYSWYPVCGL